MGDCCSQIDTLGENDSTLHNCFRRDARGRDPAAGLWDHMNSPKENTAQRLFFNSQAVENCKIAVQKAPENSKVAGCSYTFKMLFHVAVALAIIILCIIARHYYYFYYKKFWWKIKGEKIPFGQSHQTIWKWLLCCAVAVAASSDDFNVAILQSQSLPASLA